MYTWTGEHCFKDEVFEKNVDFLFNIHLNVHVDV